MCLSIYQKVGVYFPVDIGHVENYGCVSVKLKSIDLVSHSNIVIRDFLLTLNRTPVSRNIAQPTDILHHYFLSVLCCYWWGELFLL